ncbi:MAG: helix-turn-helix domain-containing protein [Solirubrobacterales bacterium]|nr:helix-turn-helix domain-containing protein [Solirubrobacterales bacterium]
MRGERSAPDLLTPAEVATQLGVSRTWLYDAARTGRIPSIRIGGRDGPLRFVPEDLRQWIDDARAEWTPGRPTRPPRSAGGRLAVSSPPVASARRRRGDRAS